MMEQTNVDYLFQVTAALAERSAADLSASESAGAAFGDHFARAAESARRDKLKSTDSSRSKDERPPQRSEFESKTSDSYASDDASDSAQYADCVQPNQSASCGDADPESQDVEANLAEPATAESAEAQDDSNVEDEPGEADDKSGEDADDLQGSLEHALAGANAAAELSKDRTNVSTAANEESSAETAAESQGDSSDSANAKVGGRASLGTSEALTKSGESTVEVQQDPGNLPSIESASTTAANAATGESSATDDTKHRQSSANKGESSEQTELGRKVVNANNALPSTGDVASTTEKTSSLRRAAAKRGSEDSVRRSNDGGEQRTVQRTDPSAANQIVGAAMQSTLTSDARSALASGSGDESNAASTKPLGAKSDLHPHALGRPGHGHVRRNGRTGDAPALPRVDASRFVGRVAKAIQTASERGGSLNLRLSPPELGSLRLQLTVDNGVMSATLEADNSVARQVLLDHLPALRDRLAEQNIRIERFDVDVRHDGSGGQPDARASQHDGRDQQPHHANHRRQHRSAHAGEELPRDPIPRQSRVTTDGINLLA
jgi:flagellar hook-length control protein FliK